MTNLPKRRFFVVIHALTNESTHALSEAFLAKKAEADGIFLIPDYNKGQHHMATPDDLFNYFNLIKEHVPDLPVGINFLQHTSNMVPRVSTTPMDFLQTDGRADLHKPYLKNPNMEFFAGLAFKFSKNVNLTGEVLQLHCNEICAIADVPTTSGPDTGKPAEISKIKEIRS